jgi:hypothetical protein
MAFIYFDSDPSEPLGVRGVGSSNLPVPTILPQKSVWVPANRRELTSAHGNERPFLTNEYFVDGYIKSQTMENGQSFTYAYFRDDGMMRENEITDPNGLETLRSVRPRRLLGIPAGASRRSALRLVQSLPC